MATILFKSKNLGKFKETKEELEEETKGEKLKKKILDLKKNKLGLIYKSVSGTSLDYFSHSEVFIERTNYFVRCQIYFTCQMSTFFTNFSKNFTQFFVRNHFMHYIYLSVLHSMPFVSCPRSEHNFSKCCPLYIHSLTSL